MSSDWGLSDRVWQALKADTGKSVRELALEVDGTPKSVQDALYAMRKRGIASVTGQTWTNRWFRVPGAQWEDLRGKSPQFRAHQFGPGRTRVSQQVPQITWDALTKGMR